MGFLYSCLLYTSEHLSAAYENGFNLLSTGCHIIIGDGLKGTDDVSVPVKGGELVKEAKIGKAIMDADVFISLSHFKGHEMAGFGGCLKNIGMGCGSRAGKMEQHNSGKPTVDPEVCVGCKVCSRNCAHGAISFPDKKAVIDHDKCAGCGRCLGACNFDAIYNENSSAVKEMCIRDRLAAELIRFLEKEYAGVIGRKYSVEPAEDPYECLRRIAESRHCLVRGSELDTEKASALLLDDFRNGRLGRITLENPGDITGK